jgi:hypothetical protein
LPPLRVKGAFAEDVPSGIGMGVWVVGEYPADCHSNVERYH